LFSRVVLLLTSLFFIASESFENSTTFGTFSYDVSVTNSLFLSLEQEKNIKDEENKLEFN
jgi:hypothetical protein